jgi:hypothetical protein
MQFNPKALLVGAVFIVLLWLTITRGFDLVTITFETLLGWGLWQWFPEDWPRSTHRNSRPR